MIEDYSFGKMVINGVSYSSDLKIINGKVFQDWWRKTGHKVDVDDIQDILKAAPDILIIGKGKPGLMKSTKPLRELLNKSGIELIEVSSAKAAKMYNQLIMDGKSVCAGFHLTC